MGLGARLPLLTDVCSLVHRAAALPTHRIKMKTACREGIETSTTFVRARACACAAQAYTSLSPPRGMECQGGTLSAHTLTAIRSGH